MLAATWAGLLGVPACASTGVETVAAFRQQIDAARQLAAACAQNAAACDADRVPADGRVEGEGTVPAFDAGWQWLRDAMAAGNKQTPQQRTAAMQAAQDRLTEWTAETAGAPSPIDASGFQHVRQTANGILARDEFRAAEGPSWLDREIARLEDWFQRAFMGMQGVGARNPWLIPLIEWSCFGMAVAGLVFFVRRSLTRQALRIALGENAAAARRSDRDATDWARLADEHAAAEDWRGAVHCLYWAAIVSLEARQAWRPDPTRTPREYLRLLRPGSGAQRSLRELTARFERAWYGHGETGEEEYRAAHAALVAIRSADLKRLSASETASTGVAAPAGAT